MKPLKRVVLEVNRAVAVGFRDGFDRGLALLRAIETGHVVGYLPYHAALGSLAERAGDRDTAASAYQVAANLSRTRVDREFFEARMKSLTDPRQA